MTDIKKILVITLSNIGDVILTFPVMDVLRRDFSDSELFVVCGPKGQPFFKDNPTFTGVYVLDKAASPLKKILLVNALRRQRFDLVVDLRNSALPFLIFPRRRTPPYLKREPREHMRQQHLRRLSSVHAYLDPQVPRMIWHVSSEDREKIRQLLEDIVPGKHLVMLAPGAADVNKRWPAQRFAALADRLSEEFNVYPVYVGDENDKAVVALIREQSVHPALDLSGELSLPQLGELMTRVSFVVSNDSAPMHLASYLDVPVVALFGPTDPRRYGPWSSVSCVIARKEECAGCRLGGGESPHVCLTNITVDDVVEQLKPVDAGMEFHSPWV